MSLVNHLIAFGLRQVLGDHAESAVALAGVVQQHLSDHSQALPKALAKANDRAWQAVAVALAGDGWLDSLTIFFTASGDAKGFREEVRLLLEGRPFPFAGTAADFRRTCLVELKQALKGTLLSADLPAVARQTVDVRRYGDLPGLVEGACKAVAQVAEDLRPHCPNLAQLLQQRPADGPPLLASAFTYFLRREIATNAQLSRELTFDSLRQLAASQEAAFDGIGQALEDLGERFDERLTRVLELGVETLDRVKALQGTVAELRAEIRAAANRNHVRPGEVASRLIISTENEGERALLRQLRDKYRKLPPEVQNAEDLMLLADSLSATGLFGLARAEHKEAARRAAAHANRVQEAEAQFKAYQNACQQGQWDDALSCLKRAAELEPLRFEPFDMDRYVPERILGAGGFGTVFLCRDRLAKSQPVAVKALHTADLARPVEEVFGEAQTLYDLQHGDGRHPAVIGVRHWGYANKNPLRPFIVMDYFAGPSLQERLDGHGKMAATELVAVARLVAEAMRAAHGQGVLHRDLKPDNILVLQEGDRWQVRVIDFGLAARQQAVATSVADGAKTVEAKSFAGTYKYAPPEQKGELPGVAVGKHSDVYTFGKTCCEALFGTTEPKTWDYGELLEEYRPLARLLERCTAGPLKHRPADFQEVVEALTALDPETGKRRKEKEQEEAERRQREGDEHRKLEKRDGRKQIRRKTRRGALYHKEPPG